MFVDIAKIHLKAGDGGNGAVSFHREKFVAAGGPDGGDGGRGGDIIFKVDSNLSTLADFRYKRKYSAENGANGGACRCTGKSAPNLVISVPRGTLVRDAETGRLIADISTDEPVVIAKGGKGGWGNTTGGKAWIEDVVVDEAFRGQGLSKQLVAHAIEFTQSKRIPSLMLTSNPKRIAANKLYQAMGFSRKETNVYRMKFE